MSVINNLLENIDKKHKGQHGVISLLCLIQQCSYEELTNFAHENEIPIVEGITTKIGFLKEFTAKYYSEYQNNKELQNEYDDVLDYIGTSLLKADLFNAHLANFDFISKQELIDVFSDFCADLGINVHNADGVSDYSLDLYLIRRTPLLRTESVIVRTAAEMENSSYEKALELLERSLKVATWNVFVTTPYGAYKVGIDRLIEDMERVNVWLYIVNPFHKRIYGVTKGKKSKDQVLEARDQYIQLLPREPIRAPSKVLKISKYNFSESDSYKSKNFKTFSLWEQDDLVISGDTLKTTPKYEKIFRSLLIIDKESGIAIFSHSSDIESVDENLVSGFLTAMDNFVSELGGSTAEAINYKGFFVRAAYGELVKIALFLSEPSDKILNERLIYLTNQVEERYKEELLTFRKRGDVGFFYTNQEIISLIRESLEI